VGALTNNTLTMSLQCILVTRKANSMMGCVRKIFVSKLTEMVLAL